MAGEPRESAPQRGKPSAMRRRFEALGVTSNRVQRRTPLRNMVPPPDDDPFLLRVLTRHSVNREAEVLAALGMPATALTDPVESARLLPILMRLLRRYLETEPPLKAALLLDALEDPDWHPLLHESAPIDHARFLWVARWLIVHMRKDEKPLRPRKVAALALAMLLDIVLRQILEDARSAVILQRPRSLTHPPTGPPIRAPEAVVLASAPRHAPPTFGRVARAAAA